LMVASKCEKVQLCFFVYQRLYGAVVLSGKFEECRRARGLSLEDVSLKTKIQSRYMAAIENEDYSELPETVYAVGFIRTYAQFLGIDHIETISQFENSRSADFIGQGELMKRKMRFSSEIGQRSLLGWIWTLLLLAIILLLLLL
jgi:cytoskeletal protein RodZ